MKKPLKISLIVFGALMLVLILFFSRAGFLYDAHCECEENFSIEQCPQDYVVCYPSSWYTFDFFEILLASLIISGIVYLFVRKKVAEEWKTFWMTFFALEFVIFLVSFLFAKMIFPGGGLYLRSRINTGIDVSALAIPISSLISLISYGVTKKRLKKQGKTINKKNWQ
jgi:hypothetical protein